MSSRGLSPGQAAEQVRALLSGLPREKARRQWMMALQAYVDGSGSGDPQFLILAGYVASSETWQSFSQQWKEQLDHARLGRFKMNEMVRRPEIAAYFYRLIEDHDILAAISVVIDTAALTRVIRDVVPASVIGRDHLENPYYVAFRAIIENLATHQDKLGLLDPIDFIFDEQSEKTPILQFWDWMKVFMRPELRKRIGSTPIFREDEKFMPLQAADLYAWWVRKWQGEGNNDAIYNHSFPWGSKKSIQQMHIVYDEAALRQATKLAVQKMPFTKQVEATFRNPCVAMQWMKRREDGVKMTFPDPTSLLFWKK